MHLLQISNLASGEIKDLGHHRVLKRVTDLILVQSDDVTRRPYVRQVDGPEMVVTLIFEGGFDDSVPLMGKDPLPSIWILRLEVSVFRRKLVLQQGLKCLINKYRSAKVA